MKKTALGIVIAVTLAFTTVFSACKNPSTETSGTSETESIQVSVGEENPETGIESGEDAGEKGEKVVLNGEYEGKRGEAVQTLIDSYAQYAADIKADPEREAETDPVNMDIAFGDGEVPMQVCTIKMGDREMKYMMEVVGEPGENGLYPLYITLHGGGGADEVTNNDQWYSMSNYYRYSVDNGIYVAVRGMEDVWNLHFLDDSYPMYDRLIEDMVMFANADPDRVYLLGFSAGGDGVYAIAPRMADRFAAVNMSSGHPNGVSLLNTSNLPFEIQVGIRDYYSDEACRSIRGAEYEKILNDYKEKYGCEYPHRVLVRVPEGHNYNDSFDPRQVYGEDIDPSEMDLYILVHPEEFAARAVAENWLGDLYEILAECTEDVSDYVLSYQSPEGFNDEVFEYVTEYKNMEVTKDEDVNAVHYVNQFTRNPIPTTFVWDLSTRANKRKDTAFYWLKAGFDVNEGVVKASYDEGSNKVTIDVIKNVNGKITVLANPRLIDFNRPLTIVTPKGEQTVELEIDKDIAAASVRETGDIYLSWVYEIPVELN